MGIKINDTLEKYCPDIVKEDLTRHFEEEMELIREEKSSEKKILDEAKTELMKILEKLKKHEKHIGEELKNSLEEMQDIQNHVGKCPICKEGNLVIKYSPKTKQKFIGCDKYPECKAIYSVPKATKIVGTDKKCEACGFPLISVTHGGRTQLMCFNIDCPKKLDEHDHDPSPKCGEKLVMRKSFYGEFIGCSSYPKCHYMCKLDGEEIIMNKKKTKKTIKTVKKTSKKTSKKKQV